jgi:hypothetical protein
MPKWRRKPPTQRKEKIMKKSVAVVKIIAEGLKMPEDASLNEILAALYLIDKDGEIMELLVQAGLQDLIDGFKEEGLIS